MLDVLMTGRRRAVVAVLILLVSVTLTLWLIRGPRPIWSNIPFFLLSMLLAPLGYFAVYGLLHLGARPGGFSVRALRGACAAVLAGGTLFLVVSAVSALVEFANHRIIPPPNFLALGLALGAMKSWELQRRPAGRN